MKARAVAVTAVFAALSTVLNILGTVIAVNTIFFCAAASFLVGIVVTAYGALWGSLFFSVCILLDFILNPVWGHVFIYIALGAFFLLSEALYPLYDKKVSFTGKKRTLIYTVARVVLFMAVYMPIMLCLPKLFVSDAVIESSYFIPIVTLMGVVAFIAVDIAYLFVKGFWYMRFKDLL